MQSLADCSPGGVSTLNCIPLVLGNIVYWAFVFAFIIALILIIVSGVKFITSGGDEKQVEGARKTFTYAIVGLILILSSFFIVQLIAKETGISSKNNKCLTVFGFQTCAGTTSGHGGHGP